MDENIVKTKTNTLSKSGVLFDEHKLLKPDLANIEQVKAKIAPDLISCKKRIDMARQAGKHILYLPGSYDLVHLGHAHYIDEATKAYLSLPQNTSLSEKNITTLILADDDDLIFQNKKSKWSGAGGTELFRRPIQSKENNPSLHLEHWRLIELASIPQVDIVAFIPSPTEGFYLATPEVLKAQKDSQDLIKSLQDKSMVPADRETLTHSIADYETLKKLLLTDYSKIIEAFNSSTSPWSIQAWQLFIHSYLASGSFSTPIVRMISHNDSAYKDQVNFLMGEAGITSFYIDDETIVSTTDLLKEHGHEKLLELKLKNYK